MKTIKWITVLALFSIFMLNNQELKAQTKENKITATYKGTSISDNFVFEDSKGNPIVFHDEDQAFKSKLSLNDEELIGKKIIVTYKWVDVYLFDENGTPTGETMKVKRIFDFILG